MPTTQPQIIVERDYDNVFLNRVKKAVEMNDAAGVENLPVIRINSGPYRPYCMSYNRSEAEVSLDFYAANRVFGFEHTIEDIAQAISKKGPGSV